MPPEEKPKEKKERYDVTEMATQTTPVIRDTKTDETYDLYTAVCKVMNDLEELKKQLM